MPCTVLIVEDDEGIRETLKFVLELDGCQVELAANGRVALQVLARSPRPDLILLDLMMPEMNGWEFNDTLKKDQALKDIPVIVVTAFGDQARTIQAQGLIKKPVDLNALSQLVRNWCQAARREPGSHEKRS